VSDWTRIADRAGVAEISTVLGLGTLHSEHRDVPPRAVGDGVAAVVAPTDLTPRHVPRLGL
jgi:hypothetical protein